MRKSTFYGLATFCAAGSLFFGLVVWLVFFDTGGGASKSMRVEQDFVWMGNALKTYEINAGRPPTPAQGLEALLNEPMTGPKPRRWTQIVKRLPVDPWNTPYRFTLLAPKEREWRWELRSAGPDRDFGSPDDLASEYESGDNLISKAVQAQGNGDSTPSY
ncbi:type II secretion system protein GspG [Luteolibacter arcticus]|uniref:Type II secretion system protein GspG n=1 Tax=Luteolibacter arcticus TaxID=1581411 RepID=A0ABT3GQ22_9BACT|nr:type II secretion system protein GspG [Luteolibacter arcticus]MCW1925580.1 type II secretion system protein GspG [Luteolibacter arcticus]